ncbi:glycoside hydrolase family 2 TIM barrel-domain containing protein, partial [Kitasatospora sp. NPDC001683]
MLTVNGRRVVLRVVNRHEFAPDAGRTLDVETMRQDVDTGIDFAQGKPEFTVRVGLGGAQHGAFSTGAAANWTPFAAAPGGAAGGDR